MNYNRKTKSEEDNDQRAMLLSISLHVLLLALVYFMPTGGIVRPPEKSAIVVELPPEMLGGAPALGLPDQGSGNNPSPGKPDPDAGNSEAPAKPEPIKTPPPPVKPVISKSKPEPATPSKRVETTEDPSAVALRRQQEENRKRAEEAKYAERERQRQEQARRDAEEAEKRQAEADAKAQQAAKDKFKGRFGTGSGGGQNGGGGTGTGSGNTGKPGNQGQPDGVPGGSFGDGSGIIGGFGGRGLASKPNCQDNSAEEGVVVIEATVNADGRVIETRFVPVGSTTTSQHLISIASSCAKQYRFERGSQDKVVGKIRFNFKNR
jgi:outer membrane biosynthesis protein TonB